MVLLIFILLVVVGVIILIVDWIDRRHYKRTKRDNSKMQSRADENRRKSDYYTKW